MIKYIKEIVKTKNNSNKESIVLRWRFLFYFAIMAIALLGCTLFLFFAGDMFFPGKKMESELRSDLEHYKERLFTYYGNTAAQGIRLSALAAKEVERTLADHRAGFDDVSDNPRLISALERNTFDILRNALLITDCSGAFIIFDATVNTSLPGSENSRCGLYLKLANINVSKPVNPEMLWTRGAHEVGLENRLIFHNKWELEFSVNRALPYRMALENASKNLMESYYYAPAMRLYGTWERIMVLFVPIVGKNGAVYGVCGFEISGLFFKLMHSVSDDQDMRLTGLIAQKRGNTIFPGTGLESGTTSGYFAELGNGELRCVEEDGLTTFTLADGRDFIGVYTEFALSPLSRNDADPWVVAYFIPKGDYTSVIHTSYLKILLCCIVFLVLAVALCWYINRQCIRPLVAGIGAVKSGAAKKTNIHEIDDLLEFLAGSDAGKDEQGRDIDMSGFYAFKQNINKLSKAEKSVFELYMKGHSAPEIADLLYVSINTVKTHNKSIYRKLNVSSRKALMVYVQMMRRGQE